MAQRDFVRNQLSGPETISLVSIARPDGLTMITGIPSKYRWLNETATLAGEHDAGSLAKDVLKLYWHDPNPAVGLNGSIYTALEHLLGVRSGAEADLAGILSELDLPKELDAIGSLCSEPRLTSSTGPAEAIQKASEGESFDTPTGPTTSATVDNISEVRPTGLSQTSAEGTPEPNNDGSRLAPGVELLVQFSPRADAAHIKAAVSALGGTILKVVHTSVMAEAGHGVVVRMTFGQGLSLEQAMEIVSRRPGVDHVEANWGISIEGTSNDPYYVNGNMWGMYSEQSPIANQFGSQAHDAWAAGYVGGAGALPSKTVVGVIDTGIDYTHPDLYLNIWINQLEIAASLRSALDYDGDGQVTFHDLNKKAASGAFAAVEGGFIADANANGRIDAFDLLTKSAPADGRDTDANGRVDDLVGWDFVNNDNNPFDDKGHGTHVAGTIGAQGGNATGVAGVAWNVQLMPLKFLNASGSGSTFGAIQAVDYYTAANKAAQLAGLGQNFVATNNSWGDGGPSELKLQAIVESAKADSLFIASAGNGGSDGVGDNNDLTPRYPGNYDTTTSLGFDGVVAVAAIKAGGGLATFSNYGQGTVELAAPGNGIYSSLPGGTDPALANIGRYGTSSGTSMAAPHVTGAIALYAALHPNASAEAIRDALLSSVAMTDSLAGKTMTGGRLDVGSFPYFLSGDGGNNVLVGTVGDDTIKGYGGEDTLSGGLGHDRLFGGEGSDALLLDEGNDRLEGGTGSDWVWVVGSTAASIDLSLGTSQGTDAGSDTLLGIENARGSGAVDTLIGAAAANTLLGEAGDDWIEGQGGDDRLEGGDGNDNLVGGDGDDQLYGGVGSDTLSGRAGQDSLYAGDGDDLVIVALGSANGGAGLDVLSVIDTSMQDIGISGVEVLTTDGAMISGRVDQFNAFTRIVTAFGSTARVSLTLVDSGTATLAGALGSTAATVIASGFGNTILSGDGDDSVTGGAGADVLSGGTGTDKLIGVANSDTLDGGVGADSMYGGAGNDTYAVDTVGDLVSEANAGSTVDNGGMDTVLSSVTLTLGRFLENLTLTGSAVTGSGNSLSNTLNGNAGDNSLYGGDGADILAGGAGDDGLWGGAGVDSMYGGAGNDAYAIDHVGDLVVEAAGGGTDRVTASVAFTLTSFVEQLTLTGSAVRGTGNELGNIITGSGLGNTLLGLAGNDTLSGALGADLMYGGSGNDVYTVDNTDDVVSETDLGSSIDNGGLDRVSSSISWTLSGFVEGLTLTGTGATNGWGNGSSNTMTGNGAANTLQGLRGDDTLTAGMGSDVLVGGAGNDRLSGGTDTDHFVFDSLIGADTMTDFVSGADQLALEDTVFTGLTTAGIRASGSASQFRLGSAAADLNDLLIYNKTTGQLFFDADGSNSGAQVLVATLKAGLAIAANDLHVV